MAITALNDYAIGDVNFNTMMTTLDKTFKGKADITIDEYDTTAAPDVKVGSVFENNGSLFIVDTSDVTPTGYAGIANSTTFYLVYDESGGAFVYSSSAPTWNDALQGWYVANDRYFFSMYKDSGGTLYQNKIKLSDNGDIVLRTKTVVIGDWNMDSTTVKGVAHGVEYTKIRSIYTIIRDDGGTVYSPIGVLASGSPQGGISDIATTNISISRVSGGSFDNTSYDSTSYNRGWVTFSYEA